MSITKFLASTHRNDWVLAPGIKVYVRKGQRYVDDVAVKTLDIANVEVVTSRRGKGVFSSWYADAMRACRQAGIEYVYVENVLSPVLVSFCQRHGFVTHGCGRAPSFIKKI